MVVGGTEGAILERVGRLGEELERSLGYWEIDVQVLKLEGMWMDRGGRIRSREVVWMGERMELRESVRVLGVWLERSGDWREGVRKRIDLALVRWRMMLKLVRGESVGMRVGVLKRIYEGVILQVLLYGLEVFWDGNDAMRDTLQKWINRGMRWILGAVRTTPVDTMLGELGWKRVEFWLNKKVERWGMRLLRGSLGGCFRKEWEEEGVKLGYYSGGWSGRVLKGVRRDKLEGERWKVELEYRGKGNWKVYWSLGKELGKERWLGWEKERLENWVEGYSDVSRRRGMIGVGGVLRERGEVLLKWNWNGGRGMMVGKGEMGGVEGILEKVVEGVYKGLRRKLVIGVDNVGVLRRLNKGVGLCGEREQRVRELCFEVLELGWELEFWWTPGHMGIEGNEEADREAEEGLWNEEREDWGGVLCWGEWERRRKDRERRGWKEYWVGKRRGEDYFGTGGNRERGHDGRRVDSLFLFWMRTGHGRMRGRRYGRGDKNCVCGMEENRDHVLLYCPRWVEERKVLRSGLEDIWKEDGWVDMYELLFGEEGVRKVLEFGRETGLMEEWKGYKLDWGRSKEREGGRKWRSVLREGENLSERGVRVRERNLRLNRLRRKRAWEREKERRRVG